MLKNQNRKPVKTEKMVGIYINEQKAKKAGNQFGIDRAVRVYLSEFTT